MRLDENPQAASSRQYSRAVYRDQNSVSRAICSFHWVVIVYWLRVKKADDDLLASPSPVLWFSPTITPSRPI